MGSSTGRRFGGPPPPQGLYDPALEHDGCGVGLVARVSGERSHDVLEQGIAVLDNLSHRGACGPDPATGDGAGMLLQVPHELLRAATAAAGVTLPGAGDYAVGMLFMPPAADQRAACAGIVERVLADERLRLLGWRDVPTCPEHLGALGRESMPFVRQLFVARYSIDDGAFARKLYVARRRMEREIAASPLPERGAFYVVSLSPHTIVYKGLLLPRQMFEFYPDLADARTVSALALVHARFSTNTFPAWHLAHPYRYLCHNGEINTLRGNVRWMRAREGRLKSDLFRDDLPKLFPIIPDGQSDSACLDNAAEFLVAGGRSLPHALMMLVPEAWAGNPHMDLDLRAFYDYHAEIMGPWDGPALVAFSDGRIAGAVLDPNGLRPARHALTRDGLFVLASEAGALELPPGEVEQKDQLRPGEMVLVDTVAGRVMPNDEIKELVARRRPYREWLATHLVNLSELPGPLGVAQPDHDTLRQRQAAFGYTIEELKMVLTPMAVGGQEAVGSMGTDTPLAVLADRPQLLYRYFKQTFAQVTNPPIDPIREQMVMSLLTHIGPEGNLLDERPEHASRIRIAGPILTNWQLEKIRALQGERFRSVTLSALFPATEGPRVLVEAVTELCAQVSRAVDAGYTLLILSDRGVSEQLAPIPMLLATAAVQHHLLREHRRTDVGLIIETGEAREVHHCACLIAYGAGSINPYLAFETLHDLAREGFLPEGIDGETAEAKYLRAIDKGLLKIFSKLGITSIRSYFGAQAMEALGLGRDLVERYFTGTPSRFGGIGLPELAAETLRRHRAAFRRAPRAVRRLEQGGEYHVRPHEERHAWSPEAIDLLQQAVRSGDAATFRRFSALCDEHNAGATLRGLLEFAPTTPVPVDEVEPATAIVRRFCSGAMSFGSIGKEAHEALAVAMNRLGGKSNTGEGGEEPERFLVGRDGEPRSSAIKQVASARFGVTTAYLVNAREIQIKISQGAKPGEGGQLPGHKVDEVIARTRYATPGVQLISPPPHHDVYSIEDLAQLIYDLKSVNPQAAISVKLVAEAGIGTVAAGCAKAHADKITISGDCGGTGASPLTSIKNAGMPWEAGLAETQQTLMLNGLRGRVRLETDGQLRTGRDVVVAALLGAEEFGFGTAALIALGCVMMRKCHLNTCPVGIATQDPLLRRHFPGRPEHVMTYLAFVAQEVREVMAALGVRRFGDLVGRADLLRQRRDVEHYKARTLDLGALLHVPVTAPPAARSCCEVQDHGLDDALDHQLIAQAQPAIEAGAPVRLTFPIRNVHRTVGAMLAGTITRRHGARGLPPGTIDLCFQGSAGQSFGAFCVPGLTLRLEGEANDYLGKGMSGGRIVVVPFTGSRFDPGETCLVGNVALYGATGGEVFLHGVAGERFGVRLSGARVVVEGVSAHGCEYMTGGVVVVLGRIGRNFAAGMSGGRAFIYDPDGGAERHVNRDLVEVGPVAAPADRALLRQLVEEHARVSDSPRARRLLDDWDAACARFVRVIPTEYRRLLEERAESQGLGAGGGAVAAGTG